MCNRHHLMGHKGSKGFNSLTGQDLFEGFRVCGSLIPNRALQAAPAQQVACIKALCFVKGCSFCILTQRPTETVCMSLNFMSPAKLCFNKHPSKTMGVWGGNHLLCHISPFLVFGQKQSNEVRIGKMTVFSIKLRYSQVGI